MCFCNMSKTISGTCHEKSNTNLYYKNLVRKLRYCTFGNYFGRVVAKNYGLL